MSNPRLLRRLLRIREIREEQKRSELDEALARLDCFQRTQHANAEMERQGRTVVGASVTSGELVDRQAGLMQTEFARRRARMLARRIALSQNETIELRRDFMDKRVERRQAETLVVIDDTRAKVESDRRNQRSLDDWYGARNHQKNVQKRIHE